MPNTINLDLVREGDQHLKRAKSLNPNVTARPVPVERIATGAFTVPELAQLAGVHPQTIRRAIQAGELRAATGGFKAHARISRTDAEVWWRGRGGGTLLGDLTPLEDAPAPTNTISRAEAKAKGYGFLKGRIRSSDDFLADKHAEAEQERQRDEARRAQSKQVAA